MAKIKTRVTLRTPQAAALIKAACNEALTDMGLQALQDVSEYVPHDFGTLENSGLTNSDKKAANGKFAMKWEEPYSQYLWNGKIMHGSPDTRSPADYYDDIKFTSDLARAEWAKYAREVYGEQWKQVFQAALKRRLK